MDAIEIFFTAYGALLALAIVKLLGSTVRLVRARASLRIGWSTPLLMLLLLLDICSLVNNGARLMGLADLNLALVTTSLLAGSIYYMTTAMVAPDDLSGWSNLDTYYDQNKRFVVGGMALGSLLGFEAVAVLVRGFQETLQSRWLGLSATLLLAFYLLVAVLFFVRNRAANIVLLASLNAIFLVVMFTF